MALRDSWIEKREAAMAGSDGLGNGTHESEGINGGHACQSRNMSQMHLARQGVLTEEIQSVAKREKLAPELIRSEESRGRMIIPGNVNHRNLEPMAIGIASKCKIKANIGHSATGWNIEQELM